MDAEALMGYYRFIVQGDEMVARSPYPRFDLEASLVRVATLPRTVNIAGAIEELQRLERKLEEGVPRAGVSRAHEVRAPDGTDARAPAAPVRAREPVSEPPSDRDVPPEQVPPEQPPPEPDAFVPDAPFPQVETEPEAPEPDTSGWDRFLAFVAGEDRLLATYLEQGRLLEISGAAVRLDLQGLYRSHIEKRENMAVLEGYLDRFFKRKMTVTMGSSAGQGKADAPPGEESGADIIDETLRIFGGTVK